MLTAAKQILLSGTGTGVRRLTLTNAITDTTRYTGVEGDGLTAPAGYGVWPAATNLVTNGGFETNTTKWGTSGAGVQSVTRITTDAKFGGACAEVVTDGAVAGQGLGSNNTANAVGVSAATAYTLSGFIKSISGSTSGRIVIDWYTGADAYISTSTATPTYTTSWARYTLSATSPGTAAKAILGFQIDAAAAATYRADGIQLETGSVATPYIETDGGTASRSAARVQVAAQGLFSATTGAVVMRLRMGYHSTTNPVGNATAFQWGTANPLLLIARYDVDQAAMGRSGVAIGTFSHTSGEAKTLAGLWTPALVGISVDGGTWTTAANVTAATVNATAEFGSAGDFAANREFHSNLYWAITFKGTPTDADAALGWMTQNAVPTLNQLAQLSAASKPTLLIPAKTADAVLLPAYFGGTL